jgi:hypothetical protein
VGKNKSKNAPAFRPELVSPGPSPRLSNPFCGGPASPSAVAERPGSPRPALVPVLAELISRGDGTFVLRPRVPAQDLDTWVTIQQAGEVLGSINAKSIYPLLGEYLVYRKPLRRKILVSLKSALALKQATQDAEFWHNKALRQRVKDQVRKTMEDLTDRAMEGLEG